MSAAPHDAACESRDWPVSGELTCRCAERVSVTVTVTVPRHLAAPIADAIAKHVDGQNDAGVSAILDAYAAFLRASLDDAEVTR